MTMILPGSLDYTNRDFASVLERLQLDLRTVFPTWTDLQVKDFGNLLVQVFSHVGDVLGFYQDAQANESRLSTAELRQNVVALAKMLNYVPRARTAAVADVTIAIPVQSVAVTLNAGRQVATQSLDPIQYQLLEEVVFAPGETSKTFSVENSTTLTDVFSSTNTPSQEFVLSSAPYIEGSDLVSDATIGPYDAVTNPTGWRRVDSFFSSTAQDAHYMIVVDREERGHLRFGSGTAGRIPSGNIEAETREGGGVEGRVEAGTLTRMVGSVENALGQIVPVTVTNADASAGGDAAEGIEQIRTNAPDALRVQDRCVSREDYEISALRVSGVARAFHGTLNEGVPVGENEGILWLVPTSGLTVPQQTLDLVAARFERGGATPKTNTYKISVASAVFLAINVESVVYLRPGFSKPAARLAIETALEELLRPTLSDGSVNSRVDFGYYYQDDDGQPTGLLPWDDFRDAIRNAAPVRKLDDTALGLLLNGAESDVLIEPFHFPRLGTLALIDGNTGDSF